MVPRPARREEPGFAQAAGERRPRPASRLARYEAGFVPGFDILGVGGPGWGPVGETEAPGLEFGGDVGDEALADLVVVAHLEPEAAVELVLGRVRAAEDVHDPRKPPVQGRLDLVVGRGILGHALHP